MVPAIGLRSIRLQTMLRWRQSVVRAQVYVTYRNIIATYLRTETDGLTKTTDTHDTFRSSPAALGARRGFKRSDMDARQDFTLFSPVQQTTMVVAAVNNTVIGESSKGK